MFFRIRRNTTGKLRFAMLALGLGVTLGHNHAAGTVLDPSVSQTRVYSLTNPAAAGQPVILYAQVVSPPGISGTPTGTVTFFDGLTSLGTSSLDDGFAFLEVTFTTGGDHPIVAKYGVIPSFRPVPRPCYRKESLSQSDRALHPVGRRVHSPRWFSYSTLRRTSLTETG